MPGIYRPSCRFILLSTCTLYTALITAPALAQTSPAANSSPPPSGASTAPASAPSASKLETVVVSAERRSTNIQKTPLAISSISAKTLDKANINELAGLNGTVPSLEITKSSGFENVVTIRGVGLETPENAPTTTPGVAVFIDGVYIANTVALDQSLFDIDHLEVLRGPQGVLYGQSATGGAINILTKQPELDHFGGSADVGLGNYDFFRERGELNIPVGSTVAVRVSIQKYDHDGFTENRGLAHQDLDDAHDINGKAAVLWQPIDVFSATLTGEWYNANQNGAAQKNIADPSSDPRVLYQDYPAKFEIDTQLYHLNMHYDAPWFSVRSVSAYQYLNNEQQEDSSRSSYALIHSYDDVAAWNTNLHNYNEELDFLSRPGSRLEWIVGGFALAQRSTQYVVEFKGTDPNPNLAIPADVETAPPGNLGYGNDITVERHSYAGFAQATFHVTNRLRITGGGRYNYDTYNANSLNFSAFQIATVKQSYTDRKPTWRGEVDYDVTPKSLVYVSASQGYKPGGVNGIASAVVVPATFRPETNIAFEIGSKNVLLGNSLRFNAAGFYYIYKNMQYIETDPVPFDGGISNIPSTHIYGLEAEGSYVTLADRLRLNANLSLEKGEIQGSFKTIDSTVQQRIESTNPNCQFGGQYYNPACFAAVIAGERDVGGNSPAKMPSVSASANIAYAIPLSFGTITPRLQYIYRGGFWARIFAEPALDRVNSYNVFNINVDYVPHRSNLVVSLTATNIGNVAGVNSRYTDPYGVGSTSQQYIPPFQIIGRVGYSF